MDLTLTWDLFIVVFFAIVVTYTFIIGKKESLKVIIASYISIVAVQGIGNLLQRVTNDTNAATSTLDLLGVSMSVSVLSLIKLILFIAIMIALTVKAGFTIQYNKESMIISIVITILCGIATAGLLLSTLLTYVSNVPLLDLNLPNIESLSPIIQQSMLMQTMIVYQDVWFSLPALVLLGAGLMSNK